MRKLNFSGAAVSLSVLTTVMGQCILSSEAVSARTLLLQGLPMALALAVISRLLALAEVEQGTFSGNTGGFLPKCRNFVVGCGSGGGHLLFQPERPAPLGKSVSGTGNDRTNAAADLRGILCSAALF